MHLSDISIVFILNYLPFIIFYSESANKDNPFARSIIAIRNYLTRPIIDKIIKNYPTSRKNSQMHSNNQNNQEMVPDSNPMIQQQQQSNELALH